MGGDGPGFGDNVRIRRTPLTESLGLAGLDGCVYGETTPSVTGVKVIGETEQDFALNVVIEGKEDDLWFAPELVEFVDHAEGTQIRIGTRRFSRDAAGEWEELPGDRPRLKPGFISWMLRSFRGRR